MLFWLRGFGLGLVAVGVLLFSCLRCVFDVMIFEGLLVGLVSGF